MNLFFLILHVLSISVLTLFALRAGKEFLIAWLCLLVITMNLFVLKQITLLGLDVTSSDALAVGYLLGLNLIQEFFGYEDAKRCIKISFFIAGSFILLSQIHLLYTPNLYDLAHTHFVFLFSPMPRLFIASLLSFLLIQIVDIYLFRVLSKKLRGKYFTLRSSFTLLISQTLDTLFFSYLGLYGLVASVGHVICLSLTIKFLVILLSAPFISLSKKVVPHVQI